jgi:hypothetical protein
MNEPSRPEGGASFRGVFIAVVLGAAMIAAALLVNMQRPAVEVAQPSAAQVRASGKCAECHRHETSAIVHEFELSQHAKKGVTCLDCHQAGAKQEALEHRGFTIAKTLTAKSCAGCHAEQYAQFARSRHAGPSWAAVHGTEGFSEQQIAEGERYHKGWIQRAPNAVGEAEGKGPQQSGCEACHSIGRPNADGSFGTCTHCHARHVASVALARQPNTCGQCHMGPDHSQIEIYNESKHGVLLAAQHAQIHFAADPKHLTTDDFPVPVCATCHMSGLEGMKATHDPTERLSWYLFAPVSERRPNAERAQDEMKDLCSRCHVRSRVDAYYAAAEQVIADTNEKVKAANAVIKALRDEGRLTPAPFDEPIEFVAFDLWHYYGRTAKHGAFMGGPDFVQWHGNYELLRLRNEIDHMAAELRAQAPKTAGKP